jgi:hypothetical protein
MSDLSRQQWRECLDEFSKTHRHWMTTVEIEDVAHHESFVEVEDFDLAGITMEEHSGDPEIAVELGTDPSRHLNWTIPHVSRISVDKTGRGMEVMEIVSEDGEITRVYCRPRAHA